MSDDEEPQLATEETWAEVRTLAANVARTIGDLGLPVRIAEDHVRLWPGLPPPSWTEHARARRAAEHETDSTGAVVTVVVDERSGHPPFVGVCVTWSVADIVRKASLTAFKALVEADEGFPDPLPPPIRRAGALNRVMADALAAALAHDGFATREDTDYRPYGLWVVTDPAEATDEEVGQSTTTVPT